MKFNLYIILSTLIVIGLIIYLALNIHQSAKEETIKQFLKHHLFAARYAAKEIELYLRDRSQGIIMFSSYSSIQHRIPQKMNKDILDFFEAVKGKYVKSLSVYNEQGKIIFSTNAKAIGLNYGDCDFFQWAKKKENKGKVFISSLIRSSKDLKEKPPYMRFLIATPIYEEIPDEKNSILKSKFVGVLTETVDLKELIGSLLSFISYGSESHQAWVIDNKGELLFSTEHQEMILKNIYASESRCKQCHLSFDYVKNILQKQEGNVEYQVKGEPLKAASFATIKYANIVWTIVINVPYDEITAFAVKTMHLTMLLIALVIIAITTSSIILYRNNIIRIKAQEEANKLKERKILEEQIIQTKNYLESILKNSLDAIFTIKKDGSFGFASKQLETIMGYSGEDLKKKHFMDLVPSEFKEFMIEKWKELNAGIGSSYEIKLIRSDGSLIDCIISQSVLKGFDEFLIFLKDNTERKRAEERLKQSEEHFRLLAESSLTGIYLFQDNRFRYVNQALASIFGYKVEEIIDKLGPLDLTHPEDHPMVREYVRRRISGEVEDIRYDFRGLRKDGNVIYLEVHGRRIEYQGKPGIIGTLVDITERKKAEEELKCSKEQYERFFMEDLTGDFICDNKGNILSCNPSFVRIFGFSSIEDALHSNLISFFHSAEQWQKLYSEVLKRRKLEYYEMEMIRKDGKELNIVANIMGIFDKEMQLVKMQGYLFDDTQRRQLEKRLIEAQKLESLGTLISGLAHDFNNLLGIILGYADLLKDANLPQDKMIEYIDFISKAASRGSSLIKQLLMFARKVEPVLTTVQVNAIISEIKLLISETFPKNIIISTELEENLPSIVADPTQIHQAILNLCLNARDAMPSGGNLSISTKIIGGEDLLEKFPEANENKYIRISVSDTGVGMSREMISRIFDPFYTTKPPGRGTGLGLTIVYSIMKAHQGFIDVKSKIAVGTTIHLYFPVAKYFPEHKIKKEKEEETKGEGTILVVEDEKMLLDFLQSILERNGYKVITAADGFEALSKYAEYKEEIAVVLLDIGLPKLSGMELLPRLQAIEPSVKVIFASGYIESDLKAEMLKAGAKDFIQKPYMKSEILKTIRKIIEE